jgi:hypothetical protein
MATRRRRRRRTFDLVVPVSLRLGQRRASLQAEKGSKTKARVDKGRVNWSRALAAVLLAAGAGLMIWFFSDLRFYVFDAHVQGTTLIDPGEVYRASRLDGYSVFYIDRRAVADRIRSGVIGVERVHVECELPNLILIQIEEGDVRFLWQTAGMSYVLDAVGWVLQPDDGSHGSLITIRDTDEHAVELGDKLDIVALRTAEGLHRLLPEIKTFQYSHDKGIGVHDARGWQIWFGDDQSLPKKVATMHAVLQRIAENGVTVRSIDLRFAETPYYE